MKTIQTESELIQDKLRTYASMRELKDALETQLKALNQEIETLVRDLSSEMIDQGVTSMKIDGVGSFSVSEERYPSVKETSALHEYLIANDQRDVIRESVHFQTLRALNNKFYEEHGTDLPGVESFQKLSIRMRKS